MMALDYHGFHLSFTNTSHEAQKICLEADIFFIYVDKLEASQHCGWFT